MVIVPASSAKVSVVVVLVVQPPDLVVEPVVVVAPGGDLTPIAVNALGEDTYATPSFADGRIYVRTTAALYAFGQR